MTDRRTSIPARLRSTALAVLCTLLALAMPCLAETPLEQSPALRTSRLDSGLRFIFKSHPSPPDSPKRLSLTLLIEAGSTDELDDERGAARLIQKIAVRSSTGFPRGVASLADAFGASSVRPDQDLKAMAGFDETTYALTLRADNDRALTATLDWFASIITGATLDDAAMTEARRLVSEDDRAGGSVGIRANTRLLPKLVPGSRMAARVPFGDCSIASSTGLEQVRNYYARCYSPARSVVLAIGDADEPRLARAVIAAFSPVRAAESASMDRPGPGEVRSAKRMALTFSDAAMTYDLVQLCTTFAPPSPVTTRERYLEELTARVGIEALRRRMEAGQLSGETPGSFTRAINEQLLRSMSIAAVITMSGVGSSTDLATSVAANTRAMQDSGPTAQELAEAKAALLVAARRDARQEDALSPDALAPRLTSAVVFGDTLLSAQQHAKLTEELLPGITAQSAAQSLRQRLDLSRAAVVALTTTDKPADEAALLKALDAPAAPPPTSNAPTTIGDPPPAIAASARPVCDMEIHAASGVLSAWLSSGARLHHKRMTTTPGQVNIVVNLAGGQIDETRETRGLTGMALALLRSPATQTRTSADLQRLLATRDITIESPVSQDSVAISMVAGASDVESAFALARELLLHPKLEEATFKRRQGWASQLGGQARVRPELAITEAYIDATFPTSDPRHRLLTSNEAEKLSFPAAQQFVERLLTTAPTEISIVGDIDRATALSLAARYLGTLPTRPRVGSEARSAERRTDPPALPIWRDAPINGPETRALVLEGFLGCDAAQISDAVMLDIAAAVLSSRLIPDIRDTRALSSNITMTSRPAEVYPGTGEFWAAAPCDPARMGDLRAAFRAAFIAFAKDGPTEAELDSARRRIAAERTERLADPAWWARFLAQLDDRARSIDDELSTPRLAAEAAPDQVLGAFRAIARPERAISISVSPAK